MNNRSPLLKKDGVQKLIASLISIVLGLLFGSILVLIVGAASKDITPQGSWEGVKLIFAGLFSTGREAGTLTWGINSANFGNMLFRATPLIMCGLSVAISQKTGLFNIGAPGQYLMGMLVTLLIALSIPTTAVSSTIVWLLAFIGGIIAGALWGAIPGLMKAFLNINEVIACIMTNWISANVVTWLFDVSKFSVIRGEYFCQNKWHTATGLFQNLAENTKSGYIYKTVWNNVATPTLGLDKVFPGSQINVGILIAIVFAIVMYIVINKTTFGFQLKACGANRHAARYAGIKDKKNIVLSMAIAGGLASAGASLYALSGNTEFFWTTYQSLPATGFNGIPVALLAINNPIGVIFSGIFMAMLDIVGVQLTKLTAYNEYITDVIIAAIVYLSAFALIIRMFLSGKGKKTAVQEAKPTTQADPAAAAPVEDTNAQTVAETEKGGEQA